MKIDISMLADFARGAALLGTGGGGDPYIGRLIVQQEILEGRAVDIIELQALDDDAFVFSAACMGAPMVMTEKLPSIRALQVAMKEMEELCGRKADAIIPLEVGGINSTLPLALAARTGLPVVNADGMGRAFPEIQMVTFSIYGCSIAPIVVTDEHGHIITIKVASNKQGEDFARSIVDDMGGQAQISCYPMTGRQVKDTAVPDTLSLAYELGCGISAAHEEKRDPFSEIFAILKHAQPPRFGKILFDGKVIDIRREIKRGFNTGQVTLTGMDDTDGSFRITFQNENLVAFHNEQLVAIVPDLITVMDRETAEPITSEGLKYGQRVKVAGISVPDIMTSADALETFGPRAFGLEQKYQSIETLSISTT